MRYTPSVTFISTQHTEANRIIHASVQIANGFYWSKKFAVLPYFFPNNHRAVYFPELDYNTIPDYFHQLKHIHQDIPLDYEEELVKKVSSLLDNNYENLDPTLHTLQHNWKHQERQIFEFLNTFFQEQLACITEIEVRVTRYGTNASFNKVKPGLKQKFSCYIRQDGNIENILECLITGLVNAKDHEQNLSWESKESITDFLLEIALQQKIINNYTATLKEPKNLKELLEESKTYLKKLGIQIDKKLKKQNQLIYVSDTIISAQLTSIQHIVLSLLIDKQNQIVSYDELANILWQDEEEFSIWAINKHLQRLRTKLRALGAEKECIQAVKGRGYTLIN